MRSRVSGRSRKRWPVALAIALASAAAAGPCAASPLPQKRCAGPVENMDIQALGDGSEPQDWVGRPIDAGDAGVVEGHALVERPADRLDDAAFDLIDQPVGIDDLAAVDGGDRRERHVRGRFRGATSTSMATAQYAARFL